ncbi:NUDIX hydrolase domain-like protein [Trichoderma barbatum]
MAASVPRVGVAAVIQNGDGKFLVGKRKGSHGAGSWQFPGGHLEFAEDLIECAQRETQEETALDVKGTGVITITNDVFEADNNQAKKHYITIFVKCVMTKLDAVPELTEPEKCEGWHWKSWEELKEIDEAAKSGSSIDTLFLPLVNLLEKTSNIDTLIASQGL